jgi:3-oxoacyl-(acyl-carrier-protein) synthase
MNDADAVITGIGVVAPTGVGVDEHWRATLAGTSRLGPVTTFDAGALPVSVVGEVTGFDEAAHVDSRTRVQTDRWTWMALAATRMALEDAGLEPDRHDPYDLAVITSSASGGNAFGQREIQALWSDGPRAVSAYQSIGWFYAASSGQISIKEQLKGSCGVLVSDGAGGLDAVAAAARAIRRGTRAVVVGGTEAALSPYALACQVAAGTLSEDPDPTTAYRPFAPDAGGHVPGEGGAMLVVEDDTFARRRGVRNRYARLAGYAATHDAAPLGAPHDPAAFERAIREALHRAGCTPADVDLVFADGAGHPGADSVEVAALCAVFGPRSVPVAIPKTMTGRLNAGGAALDLSWAALTLAHRTVPPSVNLAEFADDHILDIVTASYSDADIRTALVVARGAGGFNSALVLRRPPDQ